MKTILLTILFSLSALAFDYELKFNKKVSKSHKQKINKASVLLKQALLEIYFDSVVYSFPQINCLSLAEGDHTGLSSREDVIEYLKNIKVTANIKTYFTLSRSTTAKRDGNTIYFAKHQMNRSEKSIANTLFHELLHVAGFGHCNDNNRNERTENTIPYLLGDFIEQLI